MCDQTKSFFSQNANTLLRHCSLLEKVFGPDQDDLSEGVEHREDHPDVDHLDIRRCWQTARQPDEAEGG